MFRNRALTDISRGLAASLLASALLSGGVGGCGGSDFTSPGASAGSGGQAGEAGAAGASDAAVEAAGGWTQEAGADADSGGADVTAQDAAEAGTEAGGSCKSDGDCVGNPSGPVCETLSGKCVACVPAKPSSCPVGQYCDTAQLQCKPGCDTQEDCETGGDAGALVCDPSTNTCVGCVQDSQCPAGLLCNQGSCAPGCTAQHGCAGSDTCCGGKCVDTSSDAANCGGCAKPCQLAHAVQHCGGGKCVLDGCEAGFEDCDKSIQNGCETPDIGAGCACSPSEVSDCYTGPPDTNGVGMCAGGQMTCNAQGTGWGPCEGQVLPAAETCYTPADDDCDGMVNEEGAGCACTPDVTEPCYTGPANTRNVGACTDGTWTCNFLGTGWSMCIGQVLPTPETCLTPVDDNCNGQVNEQGGAGCVCTPGSTQPCYGGPPGTQGVGVCKPGLQSCDALGLGWGDCIGDVTPQPDVCTDAVDNDCNGVVNDGYLNAVPGCLCFPGAAVVCYTGPQGTQNVGVCKSGIATCNALGNALGACTGQVVPSVDHCTDLLDNNCNGVVNDGFGSGGQGCVCTPNAQMDCYTGPGGTLNVGPCHAGKTTCKADGLGWGACLGQVIPDIDSCLDSIDNDCNGIVNDGNHLAPGCACVPGQIKCEGSSRRVCDALGDWGPPLSCGAQQCVNGLGCVVCVPGTATCLGNIAHKCKGDGSGYVDYECDPLMGSSCVAGACTGACAPDVMEKSYIGCDFYPTVTQQHDSYNTSPHQFAVAVSNTSASSTTVTVTRSGTTVNTTTVAPNSLQIIVLPWVDPLSKTSGPSALVVGGAYRLRTNNPVTVYQYNPIASTTTNDASLLLPANAWTGKYVVASWPHWGSYPGFYAVVARENATSVTLTPSTTGKLVQAGGGVTAGGTGTVTLNQGDVLQVMSAVGGDVTGSIVNSTKPVQVIGGHECTNVPLNIAACDHLEESMFPFETLADEYIVVPPVQYPSDTLEKGQVVRVIAAEDATTLVFTPDQPVGKVLAKAGDFVELTTTTARFRVTANRKIVVAQYMVGQSAGMGTSDPAMVLAVNPKQWRSSYLIHAPVSWTANYVDLIAPTGAAVQVDGVNVADWWAVGTTGYSVAHVKLGSVGGGNHTITGNQGVSVSVYGLQNYGSYWYPGGLNLAQF